MQFRCPEQHKDEANRRVADGSGGQTLGIPSPGGASPPPALCRVGTPRAQRRSSGRPAGIHVQLRALQARGGNYLSDHVREKSEATRANAEARSPEHARRPTGGQHSDSDLGVRC